MNEVFFALNQLPILLLNSIFLNAAIDAEVKKHSRTSPDVQFKEFSLTKQKN